MQEELSFGEWLRKQRRALDLSRKIFADQVGCAEVTLRRIEAGSLKPSKELASILIEKLGIPDNKRPQWISFARGLSGFPIQSPLSLNKPESNLPVSLTSFVGREKEQVQVINLISKHRLITLTGSGGVGKTRLARKVGEQLLENYSDGVWLVELASLNDPTLLAQTIAMLFGLITQADVSHTDLLINFLRTKSVLLILDNCEHILEACAHLAESLLKSCLHLKILVTSREPLEVTGEALYRVPSLGVPDLAYQLDTLREYESVRLFEERAQLVQFDFSLTVENASFVIQICRRLDGIPLAIEMAAAKVGVLSPAQIAKQVEESFNLLTGRSRTALPRHQTLRASIEWSWNLLTESEQRLMRQLSVFAGGWTLEAAQSICDGHVLYQLNSLVTKCLIVKNQRTETNIRYSFHETIRQYAHEKLLEAGETNLLRERHLSYFLRLAEEVEPKLRGAQQIDWLNRLKVEHDNLRTALTWSLSNNVEAGLRLIGAMWWFWRVCGYVGEGCEWMSKMLALPDTMAHTPLRAKALHGAAFLESVRYDNARAHDFYEESLSLYKDLGDRLGIANALNGLGFTSRRQNDWKSAPIFFEKALKIGYEIENEHVIAAALEGLGLIARGQHNWIEARRFFEQFLAAERKLKNTTQIAIALFRLGSVAFAQGDIEVARTRYEESLSLYRELGFKQFIAILLNALGEVARYQADYEQALTLFSESLSQFQEQGVGFENNYVTVLINMGYVSYHQGHHVRAMDLFEESLSLSQKLGEEQNSALCLIGIAGILASKQKAEKAVCLISVAQTVFDRMDTQLDPSDQAEYEYSLALSRNQIDITAFEAVWAQGQKLPLDEALDLVLKTVEEM